MGISQRTVTGRIGRDAEVKQFGNSTSVEFSLAVSHYVGQGKGYNGGAYGTEWVRCVVWCKDVSEASKISGPLCKGADIAACGEWVMEVWTDKEGKARENFKLKLSRGGYDVTRPGSGDSEPAPRSNEAVRGTQQTPPRAPANNHDDVIPF